MEKENPKRAASVPAALKIGTISFVFLAIGYQVALFVHNASVERVETIRDHPDTVYVVDSAVAARLLGTSPTRSEDAGGSGMLRDTGAGTARSQGNVVVRKDAPHPESVRRIREERKKVESFRFNPNTVSVADLQRLGFSEKQAESIDRYRQSGGRFRRRSDFAKSFVVSDSVYARLEKYIDIPLLDINSADSAAFDALPGIGGYFAAKMVEYRKELGGYSYPEQLMDIWHFDREKYDGLSDLICCPSPRDSFALWTLPAEELRRHPYIRSWQTARAIVLYRDNNPRSEWTVEGLFRAGIISEETESKLSRCAISRPPADISHSARQ